jgi:RHS repeat-associated protein
MKEQAENKNRGQFLKTDGGKTKSNAIEVPSISLPKGGGAIKGIDEKFSVNAVNGTTSFSIPLPFSQARGLSPSLALSYNSGSGNSIFGLGWNLGLSSVKRKTDNKLPQFMDSIDSDTFLFSEAEDLVPEFRRKDDGTFETDGDGEYIFWEKDSPDKLFVIRFYKPRIEGLFARIERWSNKASGEIKWRVITKDNVSTLFGWTANSRISDLQDDNKIFEWLPEFVFDDKGNCTHYIYKKEDDKGFDSTLAHNQNRIRNAQITYTNTYLEKILYGNKTPYTNFGNAFPLETDYLFSTLFDYGEYNADSPFDLISDWHFRADAFSHYKAGFEIRTTRLCKRVLFFHHFTDHDEYDGLVKSINLKYDTLQEEDFTFLTSITSFGYIKKPDNSYSQKSLPPMEFTYQKLEWNNEVKAISSENLVHAPAGLDESQYYFTDLFNEGLSGILTEQSGGWYYKHNLGGGNFEQAKLVSPKPSFAGLGSVMQLIDLDADGGKQLVSYNNEYSGYFELDDGNEWNGFRSFKLMPNINFKDPNTRMLDLNGDGMPEVVITENNVFTWYPSEGRDGFSQAIKTIKPFDEEAGPHIVFADSKQTIFLSDMSGDGMTDIVRIRNGEVCYWPNMGYGKFGTKVTMDYAPKFDHSSAFNPLYIRLADIDGSGTTDIIYLGKNKFTCWKNLSGNRFGTNPFEIEAFPGIDSGIKVTVTDLLGNGVACIVWSSTLSKDARAPLKYIDLMNSKKPHLMVSYKNNLGKEVSLEYSASTKFYIEDKLAGIPWITKLHFPVHCVSKSEVREMITGARFVSSYKYHHGYYDHIEKEFRGFGMVEQTDTEDFENWAKGNASNIVDETLHQPPVLTKSWFHTGFFIDQESILTQFANEYWYEEMIRQGFGVTPNETALPDAGLIPAPGLDPAIITEFSADEWREAFRSCKSMAIRSEVFALDAPSVGATPTEIEKQLTPFRVDSHNCVIELLQPRGNNQYAVFVVKESEAINYSYERNTTDPRISHSLNIKLDEYGNVLESASVVYPRLLADGTLPAETQDAQNKTAIVYSQNAFTNDVTGDNTYRLRLASETKTYELKGISKVNSLYSVNDFTTILNDAVEVQYQEIDIDPAPGVSQKRLIEHIRSIYLSNDLMTPLILNNLESLALPYESYQLAYTPELLNDIFGTKIPDPDSLMAEGKFTHGEGDFNWWIRSGTTQYIEGTETNVDARNRFYVPVSYIDPYGGKTKVKYYSNYFLFINEIEDAIGNTSSVDLFNFRALSPGRIRDINDNLSEAISDELGMVKAMAVFGKGTEADDLLGLNEFSSPEEDSLINNFLSATISTDLRTYGNALLQHATARMVYDLYAYVNSGGTAPAAVASISREEHFQINNLSPIQLSFEYSDGEGKVVMKKAQAEPGIAKRVTVNPDNTYTVADVDTLSDLRWIGNGRTVINNKGNPVKQYEPYFSVTPGFENQKELVETGVTPVIYYDAIGRVIKTEMPDGTFSKEEFDSWKQVSYDLNDTTLDPGCSWYLNRINHLIDAELISEGKDPALEEQAAKQAVKHANTPSTQHFDTMGRPVLSVEHNKNLLTDGDEFVFTLADLDIEGNLRKVTDDFGNVVVQYKYDMLGNLVYQDSMDTGQRWLLTNILGNPLRTWDERNHEFQYFYDTLHRPIQSKVMGGDGSSPLNNIFDRIIYGDSLILPDRSNLASIQAINIVEKPISHYDTGGLLATPEYDFKGEPVSTTRTLFKNYKSVVNWVDANLVNDLETEDFTFTTYTDALGRITEQTAPDGSVITPAYNETGLLTSEQVVHVDPAITTTYIKDIDYNEKGKRNRIIYGNDVVTYFEYDKETFRLNALTTRRSNNKLLQDLHYTFDGAGNVIFIQDNAIPTTFFNNMMIEPASNFIYDALYRLRSSAGRENDSLLTYGTCDNWNDKAFLRAMNHGDPMAVRNYTQNYEYDNVGNIRQMKHVAGGNSWTRDYTYNNNNADRLALGIPPAIRKNNRLLTTTVGADIYNYPHHLQHGFMTQLPHLEELAWSFKEEVVKSVRQKCTDDKIPETTYYQYDGQGQRLRKITENQAAGEVSPSKKEERIYIASYELYKKHSGSDAGLERISLSLMDKGHRFVMIETRNDIDDGTDKHLVRYQLHNHLGSATLELDGTSDANVISYEEYHPFGTTAYQATNSAIRSAAKRYRYTGMERDEETGLSYHSARYYLPWLGRWLSGDPIGITGGINLYEYSNNNTVGWVDSDGKDPEKKGTTFTPAPAPIWATPQPPPPPQIAPKPKPEPEKSAPEVKGKLKPIEELLNLVNIEYAAKLKDQSLSKEQKLLIIKGFLISIQELEKRGLPARNAVLLIAHIGNEAMFGKLIKENPNAAVGNVFSFQPKENAQKELKRQNIEVIDSPRENRVGGVLTSTPTPTPVFSSLKQAIQTQLDLVFDLGKFPNQEAVRAESKFSLIGEALKSNNLTALEYGKRAGAAGYAGPGTQESNRYGDETVISYDHVERMLRTFAKNLPEGTSIEARNFLNEAIKKMAKRGK